MSVEKYIVRNPKGYSEVLVYEPGKYLTEDTITGRPAGYYDVVRIEDLKSLKTP